MYFRMFLIMLVSLYTVRVVLSTLGQIDYGIYNVVGGIVAMFSFLSGTMASASQRFFSFEIGRKDLPQLKRTFSMTIIIYVLIALVILLLAETIGLWFLNTQMTIPPERMEAARWVYQFSVFSFLVTILTIPYNASIMAHENMKVYAYVSIAEALLKLLIVFLLTLFSFDKLKLYAILVFIVTLTVTFLYRIYCKRKYEECSFSFCWDKELMISLLSYSGWNTISLLANVAKNQGVNILLNIFFGPIVNTARAVAYQIYGALTQFVFNLFASSRPQIIKYYAQQEPEYMWKLVFESTKLAYYLFMILSIPFFFEIEYILTLWLGYIPEYTPLIARLMLVGFMVEILSVQLVGVLLAANKIKRFQLISSSILLLNIPVSLVLLKLGGSPYTPFAVSIVITVIFLFSEVLIVKSEVDFPVKNYLKLIALLMSITLLSVIAPYILHTVMNFGIIRFIVIGLTSLLSSGFFIWSMGLNSSEKKIITNYVKNKLPKKHDS